MDEWQPIETAPKDGSRLLLGRFANGCEHDGLMAVDFWHTRRSYSYEGWGEFNTQYWPATHWQPLPVRPHD